MMPIIFPPPGRPARGKHRIPAAKRHKLSNPLYFTKKRIGKQPFFCPVSQDLRPGTKSGGPHTMIPGVGPAGCRPPLYIKGACLPRGMGACAFPVLEKNTCHMPSPVLYWGQFIRRSVASCRPFAEIGTSKTFILILYPDGPLLAVPVLRMVKKGRLCAASSFCAPGFSAAACVFAIPAK